MEVFSHQCCFRPCYHVSKCQSNYGTQSRTAWRDGFRCQEQLGFREPLRFPPVGSTQHQLACCEDCALAKLPPLPSDSVQSRRVVSESGWLAPSAQSEPRRCASIDSPAHLPMMNGFPQAEIKKWNIWGKTTFNPKFDNKLTARSISNSFWRPTRLISMLNFSDAIRSSASRCSSRAFEMCSSSRTCWSESWQRSWSTLRWAWAINAFSSSSLRFLSWKWIYVNFQICILGNNVKKAFRLVKNFKRLIFDFQFVKNNRSLSYQILSWNIFLNQSASIKNCKNCDLKYICTVTICTKGMLYSSDFTESTYQL